MIVGLQGARALAPEVLAARVASLGVKVEAVAADVVAGCRAAEALAQPGDRIVVFGSFLTVGPALALLCAVGVSDGAVGLSPTCGLILRVRGAHSQRTSGRCGRADGRGGHPDSGNAVRPGSRPHAQASAQFRNDAPIKTYTIDLSQSPSAQPTPAVVENRAPPPEEPAAAPAAGASSGPQPAAGDQEKPEASSPRNDGADWGKPDVPQPEPVARARRPSSNSRPSCGVGARPSVRLLPATMPQQSGRWAVQVGTFRRKRMRSEWRSSFATRGAALS